MTTPDSNPSDASEVSVRSCLAFVLDEEEYAIDLRQVREIVRYEGVTRVPRASAFVRGVINLRGSVVPVVDAGAALGMREAQVNQWTCLVIVETPVEGVLSPLGVLTDAVTRVLEIRDQDLEPAPSFGTQAPAGALLGMTRVGETFVKLLDVDHVFGEGGLVRGGAATSAAEPR